MKTKAVYEVTDGSNSEQMTEMLFALQNKNLEFDQSKVYTQEVKASVEFDFQKQEIRTKFYR